MPASIKHFLALTLVSLPLLTALSPADAQTPPQTPPDALAFFESRVRPLLAEHCHSCHGPNKQEGGLRLDLKEAAFKGGDAGPVILPGNREESPIIEAVRRTGATPMPPKQALADVDVNTLIQWIEKGAHWPDTPSASHAAADPAAHWSFQPVALPLVPDVHDSAWSRNPIDRFILERLEAAQLAPAPEADRRTLARRLWFDLLGLPPAPDEVRAFLGDTRPDAYERLIDRLLADPRYGERWGRHWLDVARYADTKGYIFFQDINYPWAYTYRDYVIEALNSDTPFDRFVREQLAADLLPTAQSNPRTLRALGFLTVGSRFMNNPHDVIDDRIDVAARGLMGLTVACARCHDHKYDPISTRDYYALYGIFASSEEPDVPPLFETPPDTPQARAHAAELAKREAQLADFVAQKRASLVRSTIDRAGEYLLAIHGMKAQPSTDAFMQIADAQDLNPAMLARWRAALERARRAGDPLFNPWFALAALPPEQFQALARSLIDQADSQGDKPWNPALCAALKTNPPSKLEDVARAYSHLFRQVDRLALDWSTRARLEGEPDRALPFPGLESIRQFLTASNAPTNLTDNPIDDLALVPDRPGQAELQKLRAALHDWRTKGPGAPPRAMALAEKPRPIEPRVFRRGNANQPGETVPRRFLTVLGGSDQNPFPPNSSGRLELAQAITSPENPLTARIIVNRIWLHHLGRALVDTPSDFGTRGALPTHPALLDFLAARLVDSGWSLKSLHRLILTSSTYRQASEPSSQAIGTDPENRLLSHAQRRRLDLETMRDSLLAATGRLSTRIGGPPAGSLDQIENSRRALYAHIDRYQLDGLFRTFDFPDPNTSAPKRDLTTVPPQALFWLNHPLVARAAEDLLKLPEIAASTDTPSRLRALYQRLFARDPGADELRLATAFLLAEPAPQAWPRLAQALLMTNEFITID
jgi:mono/diheme cytochrome c family protein